MRSKCRWRSAHIAVSKRQLFAAVSCEKEREHRQSADRSSSADNCYIWLNEWTAFNRLSKRLKCECTMVVCGKTAQERNITTSSTTGKNVLYHTTYTIEFLQKMFWLALNGVELPYSNNQFHNIKGYQPMGKIILA